jgi:hypothetical protein
MTPKAPQNGAKTHCPKGHPYTPENTYRSKAGRRLCRACHAAYQTARRQSDTGRDVRLYERIISRTEATFRKYPDDEGVQAALRLYRGHLADARARALASAPPFKSSDNTSTRNAEFLEPGGLATSDHLTEDV